MLKTLLWIAVMSLLAVCSLLGWAAYAVASSSCWGWASWVPCCCGCCAATRAVRLRPTEGRGASSPWCACPSACTLLTLVVVPTLYRFFEEKRVEE